MEIDSARAQQLAQMAKSGGSQFSEAGPSAEGQAQGGSGQPNESQKEAEAEGKREIMAQILSNEARERLARIQLVRPQKAQGISDLLLRMAQSGQIRGKVSEDQLVGILDQVEAMEKSKSASQQQGTIKFSRRKGADSEDDDDELFKPSYGTGRIHNPKATSNLSDDDDFDL